MGMLVCLQMGTMMNTTMPLHIPFAELADFCRRYQVRELALFGSMLRLDHGPESDVDLLVSFAPAARVTFLTLARMQRELEALEEYMQQASLRKDASKNPEALPRISRLLDALASENSCNLLKKAERDRLSIFLRIVSESAPTIHMSFATDPSAAFTAKVVSWLRINIHPLVLLQLGLQPSIAAGTIIRTTNHVFDLSLRRHFDAQKAQLIVSLEGSAK